MSNKESQFELFPGHSKCLTEIESKPTNRLALTLSFDKVLLLSIGVILVMVMSFSWGVERGKDVTLHTLKAHKKQLTEKKLQTERNRQEQIREAVRPATNQSVSESAPPAGLEAVHTVASRGDPDPLEIMKGVYTVQVASFKSERYARKEAEALEVKGQAQDIFVLPKGSYSIVCIGKFLQRQEAKIFSNKLRKKYKDCLVRRL